MSLEKWGTLLTVADSKREATETVRLFNIALAKMPLTDDEKQAIIFHYKHIVRQREPIRRTYYIYVRNLPERCNATMLRPQRS